MTTLERVQDAKVKQGGYQNTLRRIATDLLHIDHAYQRELSDSKVKRIAEQWRADLAGTILVSYRDGKFYVIDGQHRTAAARLCGIPSLLCLVSHRCETSLAEAKCFHEANTLRTAPSALEKFKARLHYSEPDAVAVYNVIRDAGYTISWSGATWDNQSHALVAISSCERIYRGLGKQGGARIAKPGHKPERFPGLLRDVLNVVSWAWGGDRHSVHAQILLGLGTFLKHYGDDVSPSQIAVRLHSVSPKVILREAKAISLGSISGQQVARVILKYMNHRKSKRLPDKITTME